MNAVIFRILAGKVDLPDGCLLADSELYCLKEKLTCGSDRFLSQCDDFFRLHDKITIAAKNGGGFDIPWMKHHYPKLTKDWHHRTLDPGPMWTLPSDKEVPSLTECLRRAGLGEPTDLHGAVGDAFDVIKLIRAQWNV